MSETMTFEEWWKENRLDYIRGLMVQAVEAAWDFNGTQATEIERDRCCAVIFDQFRRIPLRNAIIAAIREEK